MSMNSIPAPRSSRLVLEEAKRFKSFSVASIVDMSAGARFRPLALDAPLCLLPISSSPASARWILWSSWILSQCPAWFQLPSQPSLSCSDCHQLQQHRPPWVPYNTQHVSLKSALAYCSLCSPFLLLAHFFLSLCLPANKSATLTFLFCKRKKNH